MVKRVYTKGLHLRGISPQQAEILRCISNFFTISEIAKHRKTSRVSVYKIINSLLKKGFIEKKDYGIYELTEAGKKGLHSLRGLTPILRQHNLAIKVKILNKPKNWDKRRSKITTMPYFNKRVQLKNTSYDLLNYGKMQLKVTSQSIIFNLPTIYAKTVDNCVLQALDLLYEAIPKVEALYNIKLVKDYKANITIISQEYARLNDSLAKLYRKEGNKLYITDDQGKIWLIADYSFSADELETIEPNKADEDMRVVHSFFNDLRKSPTTFSEVREVVTGVLNNQVIFDKNMQSHIKAVQDLGEGVRRLTEQIEKLGDLRNGRN